MFRKERNELTILTLQEFAKISKRLRIKKAPIPSINVSPIRGAWAQCCFQEGVIEFCPTIINHPELIEIIQHELIHWMCDYLSTTNKKPLFEADYEDETDHGRTWQYYMKKMGFKCLQVYNK